MMTSPGDYLQAFRQAGADGCTVHVEVGDTAELLAQAKRLGLHAGLAVNPETPYEAVEPFLDQADLILCMTVHPGFGGQSFIEDVVPKVARVRAPSLTAAGSAPTSRWTAALTRKPRRPWSARAPGCWWPDRGLRRASPLGSRPQNSRGRDGCTSRRVNPIWSALAKPVMRSLGKPSAGVARRRWPPIRRANTGRRRIAGISRGE